MNKRKFTECNWASGRCTRFLKHTDGTFGTNVTFVVRNSEVAVLQRFGLHAISNKIDPDQWIWPLYRRRPLICSGVVAKWGSTVYILYVIYIVWVQGLYGQYKTWAPRYQPEAKPRADIAGRRSYMYIGHIDQEPILHIIYCLQSHLDPSYIVITAPCFFY